MFLTSNKGSRHDNTSRSQRRTVAVLSEALEARTLLAADTGPQNADIVIVVDRSLSMLEDGKMDSVRLAASLFADLMNPGDKISLISYASRAYIDFPMVEVTPATVSGFKTALANIENTAWTSMGAGIFRADEQLDRFPNDPIRAIVFMSDGKQDGALDPIEQINAEVDPSIKIFTVGFGQDADSQLLSQMADLRGGQYFYAANLVDLQRIYTSLVGVAGAQQQILNANGTVFPGQIQEHRLLVDPSAQRMSVGLNFSTGKIDLELVAPDGTIINRSNVGSYPNVEFAQGATYQYMKIVGPQAGQWTIRVIPVDVPPEGAHYNLYALTDSAITALASADQAAYSMGSPVKLQVTLSDGAPVLNATVTAAVNYPSTGPATPTQLTLFDDGAHGDGAAADGVYGATFRRTGWAGNYNVQFAVHAVSNSGIEFERFPTVSINVNPGPANQAPSFTAGGNQSIAANAPAQVVPAFAANISPGPAIESWQVVNFLVANSNNALFSAQPAISPDGTLTYTAAPGAYGAATVTVVAQDDGGTVNGGVDSSAPYSFTISVTPPPDAYEENDDKGMTNKRPQAAPNSPNLGMLTKKMVMTNLNTLDDPQDWYRFRLTKTGTKANWAMIDFNNAQGNLNLYVVPNKGKIWNAAKGKFMKDLGSASRTSNREAISLAGVRPGYYYLVVKSAKNAANPNYSLTINVPKSKVPATRKVAAAALKSTSSAPAPSAALPQPAYTPAISSLFNSRTRIWDSATVLSLSPL